MTKILTDPDLFHVDAFTVHPFTGNPAAICLLERERSDVWMQNLAAELNLSETAIIQPFLGESTHYQLRWFTPEVEVNLCGHATLASAHVLFSEGRVPHGSIIRFQTKSGELVCSQDEEGWISMEFPLRPAVEVQPPPNLLFSLGLDRALFVGRNEENDLIVEVEKAETLRLIEPDFEGLGYMDARGIMVTSPGDGRFDFLSRFFAPAVGIPEDPVTGSAHCCLAPYWAKKLGKDRLVGFQASERGGEVRMELRGNLVILKGHAVTVMKGALSTFV